MPKPERLIIDTTVLFSGLVFNGLGRQVIEKGIELISTDFNQNELRRILLEKTPLAAWEVERAMQDLPVTFTPLYAYQHQLLQADALIGHKDKKDVPAVALALSIPNDGIWTSDKHFDGIRQINTWTSRKLLEIWQKEKGEDG